MKATMIKKTLGEQNPCPLCEAPGYCRTTKVYKQYKTHYFDCSQCTHRWQDRTEEGWLGDDIYYGPTRQMDRLVMYWVGDAISRSLGK